MRKFFLFALLVAATAVMADIKVEDFTPEGGTTANYVTTVTTRTCTQATWTFFSGGLRNDAGNFSSTAALVRAKKSSEDIYPYFESDSISGGIDSLWLTYNSNGSESGNWNIKFYINGVEKGALTAQASGKDATPSKTFGFGNMAQTGKFVIKIVNESAYSGTDNKFRFVFDDLSWTTYAPGEKATPVFSFAEKSVRKMIGDEAFVNTLTNSSDATPTYASSAPEVATIAEDGTVTIVGVGYTTITASVAETENYKPAEVSYVLRVVPANWHVETFDNISMACIINPAANPNTCSTTPFTEELDNGVEWTYWLGGANDAVFGNRAMYLRARYSTESEYDYGYAKTNAVPGGMSRLAFYWQQGGVESIQYHVAIVVNGDTIAWIDNMGTNPAPAQPIYFELNDLQIAGDFVLEIINMTPFEGTTNKGRIVINDLEWEGYETPCEPSYGIMVDGTDYIAGELNTEAQHTEYKIEATLTEGQTFVIYDHCAEVGFMANGQDTGGEGYSFTEDQDHYVVPQDGKYTIYLKMYGYNDNWIWTAREDIPTGIENQAVKADVRKMIEDGMVVIYRNGVRYNLQGKKF